MTIKDAIEVAGLRSTAGAAELSGHVPPDRRRRGLQAPRRRGDRLREDQRAAAAFPHNQQGQISDRVLDVNGEPAPHLALLGWTGLIGVVGLPFAVASAGRTAAGLPVGVHRHLWQAGITNAGGRLTATGPARLQNAGLRT